MDKKYMRVFVDFGFDHPLTKRLYPYLKNFHDIHLFNFPYADCILHYSHVQYTVNTSLPKVLRLDGCYYDKFGKQSNRPLKESYEHSNQVIFQSHFSRELCMDILNPEKEVPSTVIYNAGDYWRNPTEHDGFNIVCCAKWRRWKRLKEMINLCNTLPFDYILHILGNADYAPHFTKSKQIKFYGEVNHSELRELYKKMDVALHLAKRDACPNSVVEFISAGIPVIVSDKGGGAAELARLAQNCVIAEGDEDEGVTNPVAQYSEEWNDLPRKFEENVVNALIKIQITKNRTLLPAVLDPEYCATRYAEVFKNAIKNI